MMDGIRALVASSLCFASVMAIYSNSWRQHATEVPLDVAFFATASSAVCEAQCAILARKPCGGRELQLPGGVQSRLDRRGCRPRFLNFHSSDGRADRQTYGRTVGRIDGWVLTDSRASYRRGCQPGFLSFSIQQTGGRTDGRTDKDRRMGADRFQGKLCLWSCKSCSKSFSNFNPTYFIFKLVAFVLL